MKALRSFLALGAFFVVVAALAGCGSGVPGDAVADVGGNPISTAAFNHWLYVAAKSQSAQSPGAPVIVPSDPPDFTNCIAQVRSQVPTFAKGKADSQIKSACKQLFQSLSSQVLGFLITAYWYQAEGQRLHIKVSQQQVMNAFNTAKKQQFPNDAAFQQFLNSTGQTVQDVLFRFRISQIYRQLLAKHNTKVTPAQIAAYYNSHKSQFGTPETRNIRIVLTKTLAQAQAAKKALDSGQSWAVVAKQDSIDPTSKNRGGQLVGVQKGQQDRALDQASFAAAINKVLGPIKGTFGYYVFEVTKITTGSQQSLAQATPLIQQTLSSQQQTTAQNAIDSTAKKHWLSQTTCRSQYAMNDCKGYKAPKTSTTSPGATTTSTSSK